MTITVESAAARFAAVDPKFKDWFPHQRNVFDFWEADMPGDYKRQKMCVYYPTGHGKTKIMLTSMALRGHTEVVVVAPPVTHQKWVAEGSILGIKVNAISHAIFRMPTYKHRRSMPLIVDEFHLLGGQTGQGWKKMDRMAAGLQAEIIIGSATPNYNDAERCYCVGHVLNPERNRGGFIGWLYANCETEENPFGRIPKVLGFLHYENAEEFLADMPGVVYLPDEAPDILSDQESGYDLGFHFDLYNVDHKNQRIMASSMEKRHQRRLQQIIDPETGGIREHVIDTLSYLVGQQTGPVLIFANHSTVAKALKYEYEQADLLHGYMDGTTSNAKKDQTLQLFLRGDNGDLIGTATLATGTDGIDKMCDVVIILDDTDDDSLRRQLVGRILPRGELNPDYSKKQAYRFVYNSD